MPNETTLDIRDALLDAPITRPIPHSSRTGPTRYEHGRARSSEQFTPKPARSNGGLTKSIRRFVNDAHKSRTLYVALITV
jgi:hypothetical protein